MTETIIFISGAAITYVLLYLINLYLAGKILKQFHTPYNQITKALEHAINLLNLIKLVTGNIPDILSNQRIEEAALAVYRAAPEEFNLGKVKLPFKTLLSEEQFLSLAKTIDNSEQLKQISEKITSQHVANATNLVR